MSWCCQKCAGTTGETEHHCTKKETKNSSAFHVSASWRDPRVSHLQEHTQRLKNQTTKPWLWTAVHVLLSAFPWDSSFPAHCMYPHPGTVLGLCKAEAPFPGHSEGGPADTQGHCSVLDPMPAQKPQSSSFSEPFASVPGEGQANWATPFPAALAPAQRVMLFAFPRKHSVCSCL